MSSKTIFISQHQKPLHRILVFIKRFSLCIFPAVISGILLLLIRILPTQQIESIYSKNLFPKISFLFGIVSHHTSLSVAGIILLFLTITITLAIISLPIVLIMKKNRFKSIGFYLKATATLLSIILLLFTITCAPNYYRYTFAEQSGLVIRESHVSELEALCKELIEKANSERELLGNETITFSELSKETLLAFNSLDSEYPFLGKAQASAKPMIFSEILSIFNLTGFYFPFTAEANVNVHMPDTELAFTICHELSHTCGFMREDEANFIGYLACMHSQDTYIRYSGLYVALMHSMNALYLADSQSYFNLRATYSEALSYDVDMVQQYWDKYYDTPAAEASNMINDTYLKANNISDGTKNYGEMVDLLLAQYRKEHGIK